MKELYTANYPKVRAFVVQNSGSAQEAKDVYQEAFVAVWKNVRKGKFEPQSPTSLNGYLFRIAKNKWIDYLRSAYNRRTISENQLYAVHTNAEDPGGPEPEKLEMIVKAFYQLGEPCRTLLRLFYFRRKSYREIATRLDMKEASARNQKYRCMKKLQKLVQNDNKD